MYVCVCGRCQKIKSQYIGDDIDIKRMFYFTSHWFMIRFWLWCTLRDRSILQRLRAHSFTHSLTHRNDIDRCARLLEKCLAFFFRPVFWFMCYMYKGLQPECRNVAKSFSHIVLHIQSMWVVLHSREPMDEQFKICATWQYICYNWTHFAIIKQIQSTNEQTN